MLVDKVLSDPRLVEDVKTDPGSALRMVEQQVLRQLPLTDPPTIARIWVIVVSAFALVLLVAVCALAVGLLLPLQPAATYATESGTILTIFTTAAGFLSGLLVPSPVKRDG
jgi:hypothetical protein